MNKIDLLFKGGGYSKIVLALFKITTICAELVLHFHKLNSILYNDEGVKIYPEVVWSYDDYFNFMP